MAETCRMMENSIRISKFNLFRFIADVKRRDITRFGVMARHNLQGPAFHKIDPMFVLRFSEPESVNATVINLAN